MKRKLYRGDIVKVAEKLPSYMSDFPVNIDNALVLETSGSEASLLFLATGDHIAWYPFRYLTKTGNILEPAVKRLALKHHAED